MAKFRSVKYNSDHLSIPLPGRPELPEVRKGLTSLSNARSVQRTVFKLLAGNCFASCSGTTLLLGGMQSMIGLQATEVRSNFDVPNLFTFLRKIRIFYRISYMIIFLIPSLMICLSFFTASQTIQ